MFIKKNKSIDTSWIKKINFGKNPNSQDLLDHINTIHSHYAGFT